MNYENLVIPQRLLDRLKVCPGCDEVHFPEEYADHVRTCWTHKTFAEMREALSTPGGALVEPDDFPAGDAPNFPNWRELIASMRLEVWDDLSRYYRLRERVGVPQRERAVEIHNIVVDEINAGVEKGATQSKSTQHGGQTLVDGVYKWICVYCGRDMGTSQGLGKHTIACLARHSDEEIKKALDDGTGHITPRVTWDSGKEWRSGLPTSKAIANNIGVLGWNEVAQHYGLRTPDNQKWREEARLKGKAAHEAAKKEEVVATTQTQSSDLPTAAMRVKRLGEVTCQYCGGFFAIGALSKHQANCYARFSKDRLAKVLNDGTGTIVNVNKWDGSPRVRQGFPSSTTLIAQHGLHYWNELAKHYNLSVNPLPGRPRKTKNYQRNVAEERKILAEKALKEAEVVQEANDL